MFKFSQGLKKLSRIKGPTVSQFRRIFITFSRDLKRSWQQSQTYRTYPEYRNQVQFLIKVVNNNRIKVIVVVKQLLVIEEKETVRERKTKKLLYSKKLSAKVGGVELRYLVPKKRDVKTPAATKRQDSYLATLRQRAIERGKKSPKKTNFNVREKASRWGTGGRSFDSTKTAKTWGSKGRTVKDDRKFLSWGTKFGYKNLRRNVRWGTASKVLDQDTNETWGTEREKRVKKVVNDDEAILKYKNFIRSLHGENFIMSTLRLYTKKLAKSLISQLE